jgi:hypothetical protein
MSIVMVHLLLHYIMHLLVAGEELRSYNFTCLVVTPTAAPHPASSPLTPSVNDGCRVTLCNLMSCSVILITMYELYMRCT